MTDSNAAEAPLVSVIIPVYNVSRYLSQCLESVIRQTYEHLEIILIDDGSTDGSGRICDAFAQQDPRIKVLHTENHGLSCARNLGMKHVSGAFLAFIDSDDWIEPQTIETLMETAMVTGADIVTGGVKKEYREKTVRDPRLDRKIEVFSGQDILSAYGHGIIRIAAWNKLYRITCFTGIRFPDGHNYEDGMTTCRLMKRLAENNGRVAALAEELFHFRMRKSSISHTRSFSNIADFWAAYRERFELMPDYQKEFIVPCLMAIGRMWTYFSTFSQNEKEKAADIILDMQSFSKRHFRQVLRGRYSWRMKMLCFVVLFRSSFVMRICCWAGKLRRACTEKKYTMFD